MIDLHYIQRYKELHKKHFNEEVSDGEAEENLRKLMVVVKLGLKPQEEV